MMSDIHDIATDNDYRAAAVWDALGGMPGDVAARLADGVAFDPAMAGYAEAHDLTYSQIADLLLRGEQ